MSDVFTVAYRVNDSDLFGLDVVKPVMDSMSKSIEAGSKMPYYAFAVSRSDEFQRIEKIESILEDQDLTSGEKLDSIQKIIESL